MKNRSGLLLDILVTQASGTAERDGASPILRKSAGIERWVIVIVEDGTGKMHSINLGKSGESTTEPTGDVHTVEPSCSAFAVEWPASEICVK